MGKVTLIPLANISTDGVQTRSEIRQAAVSEYAELIRNGVEMEPGVIIDDGRYLWLAAGHHRNAAYAVAGKDRMPCVRRQGSKWDAIRFGIEDNLRHCGERLTRGDKEHNIKLVLKEQPKLTNTAVAKMCSVSDKTVSKIRAYMESTSEIPKSEERTGLDGRTRNVVNLSSKTSPSSRPAAPGQSTEAEPAKAPAPDRCRCGTEWESDGEGGHYCPKCERNHSETPSLHFNPSQDEQQHNNDLATSGGKKDDFLSKPKKINKDFEDPFEEATWRLGAVKKSVDDLGDHAPGPFYKKMMGHLDRAGDALAAWKASER
jgi:hypothetical protein